MKLASRKSNKSRDGDLFLVKRDLTSMLAVSRVATNLQWALEHWEQIKPELETLYDALNRNQLTETIPYDPKALASPLPRAYQWADGSAYVNHVELVRKARGAEMPENFWIDPLMYQGGSDNFLGPCDPIEITDIKNGVDFEAEIAVITDDVPMGISVPEAGKHIKLILLVNDVSLRNLIPAELSKGFGFFQSKPASSFSPLALTPDELGEYWDGQKLSLPLHSILNSTLFGAPDAGMDMTFSFPQLIAHAAKTRHLSAGTIIGSGTISNRDRSKGSSCIAEKRMLELLEFGAIKTPYMNYGDTIRIEMLDPEGQTLFGAIEQTVTAYKGE